MIVEFMKSLQGNRTWKRLRASQQALEAVLSLVAIGGLLVFGTLGYMLVEGWSTFDSLYMTVITVTTVGYSEVNPLSFHGRIFTIVLMLVGIGVAMLVLTTLARIVIERQIFWFSERSGMQKAVDSLRGHTIFCGFSRLSRIAVQQIAEAGKSLVIIDSNPERVQAAEQAGHFAILGDASDEEVLVRAGVMRASKVVTLLPKDADNLYVILSCKELNPEVYLISRAEEDTGEKRMLRAGVNRLISPYRVGGQKIADGVLRPHVTDFLDIAAAGSQGELAIEEILIPENSPLAGLSLAESGLRKETNIIVAAIICPQGKMAFNPEGNTIIQVGSTLIGVGKKEDFGALEHKLIGE